MRVETPVKEEAIEKAETDHRARLHPIFTRDIRTKIGKNCKAKGKNSKAEVKASPIGKAKRLATQGETQMTKIDRFFTKSKSNGASQLENSRIDQSEEKGWTEVKVKMKVNEQGQFALPRLK